MDYQERLGSRLSGEPATRLTEAFMENVHRQMAQKDDLYLLEAGLQQVWERGLELPLSQDRQQRPYTTSSR